MMKFAVVFSALLSRLLIIRLLSFADAAAFTAELSLFGGHKKPYSRNRNRLANWTDATDNHHHHRLGLLRGVDPMVDDFYANEIDISKEGLAWLDQPGLMWEAAKKDAATMNLTIEEYHEMVEENLESFRRSGNIDERLELLRHLNTAFKRTGGFTLLLGGRNVGKSTVLKFLVKNNNAGSSKLLILYVDARLCPGRLDVGLANGIAAETLVGSSETKNFSAVLREIVRVGGVSAVDTIVRRTTDGVGSAKKEVQEVVDIIASAANTGSKNSAEVSKGLLDIFIKMAKDKNAYPVLVIDEADAVLGKNGKQNDNTNKLLTSIVTYTKQDGSMNVIMASSDYSYPYRLEQDGFNVENVKHVIFAGELAPKDMWKLLVSATYEQGNKKGKVMIGMGPHLAELCLAAYGGHVWNVERAIQNLSIGRGNVKASSALPGLSPKIIMCLDTNKASRSLLEDMAKYGFAPVETPKAPAAELISKNNIGGVVDEDAVCIGTSESKWDETEDFYALIPSSQCVRLRIAKVLVRRRNKN